MRSPTPDQQAVLASAARVRVVRAAPGSGKTWLVAEVIRRELGATSQGPSGVAALSFTRVGGDEIREALGRPLGHPHFVGTIDSFLFRYVVRPHIRAIDSEAKTPELIPADWRPREIWTSTVFGKRGINPFACVWLKDTETRKPILGRALKNGSVVPLDAEESEGVRRFKGDLLRKHGRITLADSALLASLILRSERVGQSVRAEVIRRFPLIIVDELQDTGTFLCDSLKALLQECRIRGLLVGDPDQAIYEFNGAAPAMFDTFAVLPGAESMSLRTTLRCPVAVVAAASHLKRSSGEIHAADGRSGRAFLVHYTRMAPDVAAVAEACRRERPNNVIKVVARSNATVDELTGRATAESASLHCAPATKLQTAVRLFLSARSVPALAFARATIENCALGGEGLTTDALTAKGIDPASLSTAAIALLIEASRITTSGTVLEWQSAVRELLIDHVARFCSAHSLRAPTPPQRPKRYPGHDALVANSLLCVANTSMFTETPVLTVHGVKGETHDITIFVTPSIHRSRIARDCPSNRWWPADGADDEERRIAYVAVTRTRGDLILCVDDDSFGRLRSTRSMFVAGFTCLTPAEFQSQAGRLLAVDTR